jgi:MFS family permease
MLINRSGTMVLAFLTLYCTQYLHQTPKLAGFAIAVYGLGSILGAYFGGRLSDKFGYHFVQVSALIGGGFFFILAPFAQNFHFFNNYFSFGGGKRKFQTSEYCCHCCKFYT